MLDSQFMLFSKHLQELPLAQAGEAMRHIGLAKIDLTVRPGGHAEPARVETDLPAAAETLRRVGISIGMITTNITDAADPLTEPILRTAAALGIGHYKLGYFRYAGFGQLRRQRIEIAARLKDLAAVNAQFKIHGGCHNHSDHFFGANLADLDAVLTNVDPKAIGVYLDPAHAVIEGGSAGWRMALDLIAPRVAMLAVKDFRWLDYKTGYAGARRHSVQFCPLATGNTPWPAVIAILKSMNFAGPISFHSEYQGQHSFADLSSAQVIEQTAKDLELFRAWMAGIG